MSDKDPSNELVIVDQSDGGIAYLEHGSPSDLIRWHSHYHYELHLIVNTKGKVFIGDYIGRYNPGQLILTGPNVPHNWITDKDHHDPVPIRDMAILFSHESIENVIQGFPEAQELMTTLELSRAGVEFVGFDENLSKELFSKVRDATGIERLINFLQVMTEINRWPHKRTLSTTKVSSSLSGLAQSKINDVVKYITSHYQDDLSLKQVADLVNMSESSFSRHFQKATCNKFVEFVNRVRIGRACNLLAETNTQISSICFDVGFKNITNFNRQFYKFKGQTPGDYRKTFQINLGKEKPVFEKRA
ncbi:MAG: AraC family transcriptional regulator [Cellvibrionaceae bacterium]